MFDDGHHKFALAWHFMGMAEQVHAWIDRTEIAPGQVVDSPAFVTWKFPGGRYGMANGTSMAGARAQPRLPVMP